MPTFNGFAGEQPRLVRLPEAFFGEVLPQIDHLGELRLILHVFWRLEQQEGAFHYLRLSRLLADQALLSAFGPEAAPAQAAVQEALERAVGRGVLLRGEIAAPEGSETLILVNSPRGRAALEAIEKGVFRLDEDSATTQESLPEAPNIYRLYESHIGPLTPMIAEDLRDAEDTYPADWIAQAFQIAVERKKRSWRYIEAILRRWQERGSNEQESNSHRPDSEKSRQRYSDWEG